MTSENRRSRRRKRDPKPTASRNRGQPEDTASHPGKSHPRHDSRQDGDRGGATPGAIENRRSDQLPSGVESRRALLKKVGAVAVASGGVFAAAGAGGKPDWAGNGPCDGALLAKYEVEDGEFLYEKGEGDVLSFDIADTKDGDEILAFDWEVTGLNYLSGLNVFQHPFSSTLSYLYISSVIVKTGDGTFHIQTNDSDENNMGEVDVRNLDDAGPNEAVSFVAFCYDVYWQVDFATDEVVLSNIDSLTGEYTKPSAYSGDTRIMAAAVKHDACPPTTGEGLNHQCQNGIENPRYMKNGRHGVHITNSKFDISTGLVSVEFEVNRNNPIGMSLASFEMPGPWHSGEINGYSVLFDATEGTFAPGNTHEMTINIPTV